MSFRYLLLVASIALDVDPLLGDDATASYPRSQPIVVEGEFGEGWRQVIPANDSENCDRFELWVDDGWFFARRTDSKGDLDWQFRLASVDTIKEPTISMANDAHAFEVASADGHYFVRETLSFIRVIREQDETYKGIAIPSVLGEEARNSGRGQIEGCVLSSWVTDDWFYVATGPDAEHMAGIVRLNPMEERQAGWGVSVALRELLHYRHGPTHLWDDGQVLIAERTLRGPYEEEAARRKLVEELVNSPAPAIAATEWLNSAELKLEDLKGDVVLLDFWATWCRPCVAKLPEVQKLVEEYGDQGFRVIAVHDRYKGEDCPEFIKEKGYTFPVAIDGGETVKRYGVIGVPTYVLIAADGRVAGAPSNEIPKAAEIERLLEGR